MSAGGVMNMTTDALSVWILLTHSLGSILGVSSHVGYGHHFLMARNLGRSEGNNKSDRRAGVADIRHADASADLGQSLSL
jgi:hypothetical protein